MHRKNISNWTGDTDIFAFPYLVIPIHTRDHWAVFFTHISHTDNLLEVTLYDSMPQNKTPLHPPENVVNKIIAYLKSEWNKLRGDSEFPRVKPVKIRKKYIQKTDYECGVCMLHFIDVFTRATKETDMEENLKRTISNFNSKIASEVRIKYRDLVIKCYKNGANSIHTTSTTPVGTPARNGYLLSLSSTLNELTLCQNIESRTTLLFQFSITIIVSLW